MTKKKANKLIPGITFIRANLKKISAWSLAVAAPIAAYAIEPVREVILHTLWKENVEILINATGASEGENIDVGIILLPTSQAVGISNGVVEVSTNSNNLKLLTAVSYPFEKNTGPISLPIEGKKINFRALEPGEAEIAVHVRTNYGTYRKAINVTIDPIKNTTSEKNFTGRWNVHFGGELGYMEIVEKNLSLVGFLQLNNNSKEIPLSGIRDGSVFVANISWNDVTRWIVTAEWTLGAEAIEIVGVGERQELGNGTWMTLAAADGKAEFQAVAKIQE